MAKLLIIKHPNKSYAEIQTTDRLCDYRYKYAPPSGDELPEKFIKFRDKLRAIYGLEDVKIGRHDISMERYEVFEWEGIITEVIAILKEYTGSEYEITTDDRTQHSYRDGSCYPSDDDMEDAA